MGSSNITLEIACAELQEKVYNAALYFEVLEHAGKIRGNGQHAAQRLAKIAVEALKERWIDESTTKAPPPLTKSAPLEHCNNCSTETAFINGRCTVCWHK